MVQTGAKLCCPSVPVTGQEASTILMYNNGIFNEWFRVTNAGIFTKTQKILDDDKEYSYCKFLTEDGRCSVYSVRPQICRSHNCEGCNGSV